MCGFLYATTFLFIYSIGLISMLLILFLKASLKALRLLRLSKMEPDLAEAVSESESTDKVLSSFTVKPLLSKVWR